MRAGAALRSGMRTEHDHVVAAFGHLRVVRRQHERAVAMRDFEQS
ncbi:MAG: hypothetical protein QOF18_1471, partial [Frankiaceae bacterium]|nr:hypothetical protein [Frankiaceae bacterium]